MLCQSSRCERGRKCADMLQDSAAVKVSVVAWVRRLMKLTPSYRHALAEQRVQTRQPAAYAVVLFELEAGR
jgi:hypothetical protein